MSYVYLRSEDGDGDLNPGLWTVGFYKPDGKWEAESDHESEGEAAERVSWLNGSAWSARCHELESAVDDLNVIVKRLSNQVRDSWPRCTCDHCYQQPSEASSDNCAFVKAWTHAIDNAAAINREDRELRRRMGNDYPYDDAYVGRRNLYNRFDGSNG